MKKLLLTVFVPIVAGVYSTAAAVSKPASLPVSDTPLSVIDGIDVPLRVLMEVNTGYQGFAVTKVSRQFRDGKKVYVLQASLNTDTNLYESKFLLYDENWIFVKEVSPPPRQIINPKPVGTVSQPPVTPREPVPTTNQPQSPPQDSKPVSPGPQQPPQEQPRNSRNTRSRNR